MKTTCKECGKQWGGMRAEHCMACHSTFSGTTAGDRHRRGEYPERTCSTEDLVHDQAKDIWRLPGTWAEREHG